MWDYLGCSSAVWRDQPLPATAALNWTPLVSLRHTNFAARPDRWDFKGKISLMHPEKLPSQVPKLPLPFSEHPRSFHFRVEAGSRRCKTRWRQWRVGCGRSNILRETFIGHLPSWLRRITMRLLFKSRDPLKVSAPSPRRSLLVVTVENQRDCLLNSGHQEALRLGAQKSEEKIMTKNANK